MKIENYTLRILVCGDRNWQDRQMIRDVLGLYELVPDVLVIDGMAPGADTIGNEVAEDFGMGTRRFKVDWDKYGLAAGPIRNQKQLDEGKPHLILAFHQNIANSKGTKDMVKRARKAGIPTCIFPQKKFA